MGTAHHSRSRWAVPTLQNITMLRPDLLLVIATLLPLASFTLLVFVGKRMGNPLAGYLGTASIGGSFVCSMAALITWINGGDSWGMDKLPISVPLRWVPVGVFPGQQNSGYLDVGLFVDSVTVVMLAMITLVATLVHVFSIGYMHEDKRFPRFFTYLSLFCFSMLGLVIGDHPPALHLLGTRRPLLLPPDRVLV